MEPHGFGWALIELKRGKKLTRAKWRDAGVVISLEKNGKDKMFVVLTELGEYCEWVASTESLLARDWEELL